MQFPNMRDDTSLLELKELRGSHERIIRLATMGMSRKDIAAEVGCTIKKVHYTLNGALGSQKLESLRVAADIEAVDIAKKIHETAEKAIDLMDEVVSGDNREASIKERIDVAKEVLRMDGYTPIQKQQIDVHTSNLDRIGLEKIRDRATKLRLLEPPEVIEAEFTPKSGDDDGEMPEGL